MPGTVRDYGQGLGIRGRQLLDWPGQGPVPSPWCSTDQLPVTCGVHSGVAGKPGGDSDGRRLGPGRRRLGFARAGGAQAIRRLLLVLQMRLIRQDLRRLTESRRADHDASDTLVEEIRLIKLRSVSGFRKPLAVTVAGQPSQPSASGHCPVIRGAAPSWAIHSSQMQHATLLDHLDWDFDLLQMHHKKIAAHVHRRKHLSP